MEVRLRPAVDDPGPTGGPPPAHAPRHARVGPNVADPLRAVARLGDDVVSAGLPREPDLDLARLARSPARRREVEHLGLVGSSALGRGSPRGPRPRRRQGHSRPLASSWVGPRWPATVAGEPGKR